VKRVLQVCAVAGVLTLFYAATGSWSFGAALSAILTAITLAATHNGIRATKRIERIAILAWLYWGLSYISNLIEAVYFQVIPVLDARRTAVIGLGIALLVACILEGLMPGKGMETVHRHVRSAPNLWWRIPLLDFLFFVIYLAGGIAIQPWIMSFYQNRALPSLGQLFALQLCRGLLDIACIFPLLYRWNQSRRRAAWLSACIFTVLCGWGPLLLPNRFMPGPIRFAHGVEMGGSGILFGIVTAMLLLKPEPLTPAGTVASDGDDLDIANSPTNEM
jgi:hypothetical protein